MPIKKNCLICNKEFFVVPAKEERAKYCSKACLGKANAKRLNGNQYAAGSGPNSGSFKQGNIPWNKGLKGIHLSPDSEFKPGRREKHYVPIGTMTIRADRSGNQRKWIKTIDGWFQFANILYTQKHGPIPDGSVVHHKDRNTLNDSLDNLMVMTRSQHLEEHRSEIREGHLP